jgi:hypothetical protein
MMAQLNIKDDETHRMAGDLARLTRSSAAAAVKTALAEALERRRGRTVQSRIDRTMALLAGFPPLDTDMTSAEMMEQVNREWEIDNGLEPYR